MRVLGSSGLGISSAVGAVADWFQARSRRKKTEWLVRFAKAHEVRSVLFVGTTGMPGRHSWENQIELAVSAMVEHVVFLGLNAVGELPYLQGDARYLPFRSQSFDLVFSNAVVEHVGDESDQRLFVAEHRRVGKYWALTTPNRFFPVESHTRMLLRHWSSSWRARQPLFTRLLSKPEVKRLAPSTVIGSPIGATFTAYGGSGALAPAFRRRYHDADSAH